MKYQVIAGIALVALGAVILFRGVSYPSQRSVMRVGNMEASVEERRAIPTWLGGVAMAGGLVLGVAGLRRRHES